MAVVGEYLKLHPEMAHELMVPSGFKERIPRRYERMLAGERSLSSQNGLREEAKTNSQVLDAMLIGPRKFVGSHGRVTMPEWYELVNWVHSKDEAREFENLATGETIRVIAYKRLQRI